MRVKYALCIFLPFSILLSANAFYIYQSMLQDQSDASWRLFYSLLLGMVALTGLSSWFVGGGIAARRKNPEERHESEGRFGKYLKLNEVGVGKTSAVGNWLEADGALCNLLGYSEPEFRALSWSDVVYPEDLHMANHLVDLATSGEIEHYATDIRLVNRSGDIVFAHVFSLCVRRENAAVDHFENYITDVAERQKVSQSLSASERQHRSLFEDAPLMYVLTKRGEPSPTISDANQRFLEKLGYAREEVIGQASTEFYTPDSNEKMLSAGYRNALEGSFKPQERQLVARDGSVVETLCYALPEYNMRNEVVGTRAMYVDMDDRRALEEEHRKNQNLEALGILAGGIAHDFNNVLTAVIGSFELLELLSEDRESKTHAIILNGKNAAERTRGLTQQLITFAKGGAPVKQASSMKDLIQETVQLLLRGSQTVPEFHFDEDLYTVNVDYGQMGQVIQNLVINADQAMNEGGTLTITAKNMDISAGDSIQYFHLLESGPYVKVSVEDQGTGLPDEALKKIFNPYFTTKEAGHGLGLSIVHSIIQRHDGYITARSEEGKGATFEFYLPALPDGTTEKEESVVDVSAGEGRILIVDDEEAVHQTVPFMLEEFGYLVESARGGEEAVNMYREAMSASGCYDLVIMDLTMPAGMNGEETANKIHELDDDARIIASSGYANNPVMNDCRAYGFKAAVKKPVQMKELLKVVGNVIGDSV